MIARKSDARPINVTIPEVGSAFRVWDRQRRRFRWVHLPTHSQIEASDPLKDDDEGEDDWEALMALLWKQKKH